MLNHVDEIESLENFEYPNLDVQKEDDAHDMLIFSISLRSWVSAARNITSYSEEKKANLWNLECVGKFGISSTVFEASSNPNAEFQFTDIPDGEAYIDVYGDIELGFFNRFSEFILSHPEVTKVRLGSGGGSISDAIEAGTLIRRLGLNTELIGNCYSACPLVFLGGVERIKWASADRFGFHRIYDSVTGKSVPLNSDVYDYVRGHIDQMGADSSIWLNWLQSADPEQMYEPHPRLYCVSKLTTFTQHVCNADEPVSWFY